jgi:hypothetical protein
MLMRFHMLGGLSITARFLPRVTVREWRSLQCLVGLFQPHLALLPGWFIASLSCASLVLPANYAFKRTAGRGFDVF